MKINFDIKQSIDIEGVFEITPSISDDKRGTIWTSYISKEIDKLVPKKIKFTHDKFSESKKNVLRGIHGDHKSWKLVTCVYGTITQVVVDLRKKSKTINKFIKYRISHANPTLILSPPNMGNAYLALSNNVIYHYKLAYLGDYIDAKDQFSFRWNDEKFNIDWGISNPILSERDNK